MPQRLTTSEIVRDLPEKKVDIGGVRYNCTVLREEYHAQDKSSRWL